jgi:hypothetical protein
MPITQHSADVVYGVNLYLCQAYRLHAFGYIDGTICLVKGGSWNATEMQSFFDNLLKIVCKPGQAGLYRSWQSLGGHALSPEFSNAVA